MENKTKNIFMIKIFKLLPSILLVLIIGACGREQNGYTPLDPDKLMIRIAELEIEPGYLDAYLEILREEAETSIRLEPGVISIFPMQQKQNSTQIRIVEIYASKEAYEAHLKSPHFIKYKDGTAKMVKSLQLVDMKAVDNKSMPLIFHKLNSRNE